MRTHVFKQLLVFLAFAFSIDASAQESPVYVAAAADFTPADPGLGDVVSWKPGTADEISGLVFGTNAFSSVKEAVDGVNPNETVFIAAGTYAEGSTIQIPGYVTLQGDGAGLTTITGSNAFAVLSTYSNSFNVIIDGISIIDGSDSSRGAGIYNNGELLISNCMLSGHEVTASNSEGAAIYNAGEMTIRNTTVTGNTARRGGAISNVETMTLINVTVSGNTAGLDGGGIFQDDQNATLSIKNSTISGNTANQNNVSAAEGGGGIANMAGALTVENTTISGNSIMRVDGGGIYTVGPANIIHATITGNRASSGDGGGIRSGGFSTTVSNTMIAGNTASFGTDTRGDYTGAGINFIGIPEPSGFIAGFRVGTDLSFASTATVLNDLIDTTLSANGGPTLTHRPKAGSAAIDAGDTAATAAANITFDQRGTNRIANAEVDIGAVEIPTAPQFLSSSPAAGSTGLPGNSILVLTFDQPIRAGGGAILLRRSADDSILPSSVTFAGNLVTITPDADLPLETEFHVEVAANAVLNIEDVPFSGISDPTALRFATSFETVYVSQNLIPSNPEPGDLVTWIGESETIPNLIFGRNAFASVQKAVDEVFADGTVILAANTFPEGSPIVVGKGLTLRGQGKGLTILSGNDAHRVIHILAPEAGSPNDVVNLEMLSVRNGRATGDGAGILNQGADLTVRDSEFSDNLAVNGSGGGLANSALGQLTVSDSGFFRNSASEGGAISFDSGLVMEVSRCLFSENSALGRGGAGGGILKTGSASTAAVTESTFVMNTALDAGVGAGIANLSSGLFTVDTCTFSANSVAGDGSSAASGGAIHSRETMVVLNSTLSGNTASQGNGGAISNFLGDLTISNSTISGNRTNFILGGTATAGLGAGIYTAAGTLTIAHSTIIGNTVLSNSGGRGIYNRSVNGTPGDLTLINSMVAGNVLLSSETRDILGHFISEGVNLIGTLEGSIPSGTGTNLTLGIFETVGDIINTTLADNGGPTLTHLPLAGSPLVNGGSNGDIPDGLTTDQRGFPRIDEGMVDIGAVEFHPPPSLLSITPNGDSGSIDRVGHFVLTFDKELFAGAGTIQIRRADTHAAIPASVSISGNVVTVTTVSPLPEAIRVYIEIGENALLNLTGDAFPAITDPGELGFFVCAENVYVGMESDFIITGDQGSIGVLDDGDGVTWSDSTDPVAGLVFGVNAFTSVQRAVDAVCDGGTVHLAPAQYQENSEIVISRSLTLLGDRHERSELGRFSSDAPLYRIFSITAGTDVIMDRVTVTNGHVTSGLGAGILNNGNLTVRNSTFSRNENEGPGGAIAITAGASLTAINSTISGNLARYSSGGAIDNGGTVALIHCTIANNTAWSVGGGILNRSGGTLTLTNSIVGRNTSPNSPEIDGSFTGVGVNFIGDPSGSTRSGPGTELSFASTGTTPNDLLYSNLSNIGGPTSTHALVPGSPAINAGDNDAIPPGLLTDQRGLPRILDTTVDLGAVEDVPELLTPRLSVDFSIDLSTKISIADLLGSVTGGRGLPVTLKSVSDPAHPGSTVRVTDDFLIYTPAPGLTADDSFTYMVTDGFQSVQGRIELWPRATDTDPTPNIISITLSEDTATIQAAGIPGLTYQLESSENLTSWEPLGDSMDCPAGGVMTFTDAGPLPPTRFYRLVDPRQ